MSPSGGGQRRPRDLEIFGVPRIGVDNERRNAVKIRMMLDLVAHRRLARGHQHRLGAEVFKIDEPRFGCVVIVHRDRGKPPRLKTR